VGSYDVFAPRLATGEGIYNLIAPFIDLTGLMVAADLVEPIDASKVEGEKTFSSGFDLQREFMLTVNY